MELLLVLLPAGLDPCHPLLLIIKLLHQLSEGTALSLQCEARRGTSQAGPIDLLSHKLEVRPRALLASECGRTEGMRETVLLPYVL